MCVLTRAYARIPSTRDNCQARNMHAWSKSYLLIPARSFGGDAPQGLRDGTGRTALRAVNGRRFAPSTDGASRRPGRIRRPRPGSSRGLINLVSPAWPSGNRLNHKLLRLEVASEGFTS